LSSDNSVHASSTARALAVALEKNSTLQSLDIRCRCESPETSRHCFCVDCFASSVFIERYCFDLRCFQVLFGFVLRACLNLTSPSVGVRSADFCRALGKNSTLLSLNFNSDRADCFGQKDPILERIESLTRRNFQVACPPFHSASLHPPFHSASLHHATCHSCRYSLTLIPASLAVTDDARCSCLPYLWLPSHAQSIAAACVAARYSTLS
jgi:hypothetical protein